MDSMSWMAALAVSSSTSTRPASDAVARCGAAWAAPSGERRSKWPRGIQHPGRDRQLLAERLGYRGGQG